MIVGKTRRQRRATLPVMGKPSYDAATLDAYFHQVHPSLFDDPVVGAVLQRLRIDDPDVIDAVIDVDRPQVRDAIALEPMERLRRAVRHWNGLMSLRRGA